MNRWFLPVGPVPSSVSTRIVLTEMLRPSSLEKLVVTELLELLELLSESDREELLFVLT